MQRYLEQQLWFGKVTQLNSIEFYILFNILLQQQIHYSFVLIGHFDKIYGSILVLTQSDFLYKYKTPFMNKLFWLSAVLFVTLNFSRGVACSEINTYSDSLKVLKPKPEHSAETNAVLTLLNNYHYRKTFIDDSLSSTVFDNFFESLDPE